VLTSICYAIRIAIIVRCLIHMLRP